MKMEVLNIRNSTNVGGRGIDFHDNNDGGGRSFFVNNIIIPHQHARNNSITLRKNVYTGTVRSVKRKNLKNNHVFSDGDGDSSVDECKLIDDDRDYWCSDASVEVINNKSSSKMPLVWNTSGWIRVYCGPDRSDLTCDDPSRMVHVVVGANTSNVVRDMDLPEEYTLWVCKIHDRIYY